MRVKILLKALMLGIVFLVTFTSDAFDEVIYNNIVSDCSSVTIDYQAIGGYGTETMEVYIFTDTGTGFQSNGYGTAPDATGSITVNMYNSVPDGTMVYVEMEHPFFIGTVYTSPTVSCGHSVSGGNTNTGGWSGYSDGRLNPEPAEYYSIYCQNDWIEVYQKDGQLLKLIDLYGAYNMTVGSTLMLDDNLTIQRTTNDLYTITGNNGNLPGMGQKTFPMSACISSNGGDGSDSPLQPCATSVVDFDYDLDRISDACDSDVPDTEQLPDEPSAPLQNVDTQTNANQPPCIALSSPEFNSTPPESYTQIAVNEIYVYDTTPLGTTYVVEFHYGDPDRDDVTIDVQGEDIVVTLIEPEFPQTVSDAECLGQTVTVVFEAKRRQQLQVDETIYFTVSDGTLTVRNTILVRGIARQRREGLGNSLFDLWDVAVGLCGGQNLFPLLLLGGVPVFRRLRKRRSA